ncbi:MAG: hypothetical protein A2Z18_11145 [Armatimonadetes bacterium RBG_16_58_9]|nr:MAG: hypothetical protein A2Z18_11145 [Armatimonadetes bacterium RBG_16_58_9]
MKALSITCHTQDGTVSAKSVTLRMGRCPKWYGRVPASISLDMALSDRAVRVYSILALKTYQGNIATFGSRQLGELIGVSRMSALRAIKELVAVGHLKASTKNGSRAFYELTSPVFAQKQGRKTEIAVGPSGGRRLVSIEGVA